jgi:hypothetical protein
MTVIYTLVVRTGRKEVAVSSAVTLDKLLSHVQEQFDIGADEIHIQKKVRL